MPVSHFLQGFSRLNVLEVIPASNICAEEALLESFNQEPQTGIAKSNIRDDRVAPAPHTSHFLQIPLLQSLGVTQLNFKNAFYVLEKHEHVRFSLRTWSFFSNLGL